MPNIQPLSPLKPWPLLLRHCQQVEAAGAGCGLATAVWVCLLLTDLLVCVKQAGFGLFTIFFALLPNHRQYFKYFLPCT